MFDFPHWLRGEIIEIRKSETTHFDYTVTVERHYVVRLDRDSRKDYLLVPQVDLMLEEDYNKQYFSEK